MSEMSDEDLAIKAGQGDRKAFETLEAKYSKRVLGFIFSHRIFSGFEDVAQEVWWTVWQKLPRWKADNFRAWLFRIAHHKAIDYLRHAKKNQPFSDEIMQNVADSRPISDPDAMRKLADCLKQLPAEYRQVIELRTDGTEYEEMAARLEEPVGTIKSRLSRARNRLKDCLGLYAL